MKLENQIAVVTGGASGIGRAIIKRFNAEGARCASLDLNPSPDAALSLTVNVSDSAAVSTAFAEIATKLGPVDVLVNGAGQAGPLTPAAQMKDEDWDSIIHVHLNGTFYCSRAALRVMQPRHKGRIINIASVAALRGFPGGSSYAAAKGAIVSFTRSIAQEAAPDGVLVNAIAPGWIDTPIVNNVPKEFLGTLIAQVPLGRIGQPDEVAGLALFLASNDSTYMVGQVVSPNGGIWF
jgi:NAD(P)-dependent dehydrogenase (short-subunit alcohol dehydrogenase family)